MDLKRAVETELFRDRSVFYIGKIAEKVKGLITAPQWCQNYIGWIYFRDIY